MIVELVSLNSIGQVSRLGIQVRVDVLVLSVNNAGQLAGRRFMQGICVLVLKQDSTD